MRLLSGDQFVTDLILVRHGQATHNPERRWEGWGPTPLTDTGRRQAEAVAQRLADWYPPISCLYTSPILRARQTAAAIAHQLGMTAVAREGFREIDFGQVSGMNLDEFRDAMPDLYGRWQDRSDPTFQYPQGEQRLAFFQRVGEALDDILAQHVADQVAVVAHGGTIRAGLAHLFPDTMSNWWTYPLRTGSISHVRVNSGGNVLLSLSDCQHLDGEP
jgi:probable phosphoglycerate mutase